MNLPLYLLSPSSLMKMNWQIFVPGISRSACYNNTLVRAEEGGREGRKEGGREGVGEGVNGVQYWREGSGW